MERWRDLFELGGTIAALLFTGMALHVDARARRAQTRMEITKQHRDLWTYFFDRPHLASLFDRTRDLKTEPLKVEEVHFMNLLVHHIRAGRYAHQARIYVAPERLPMDMREVFSLPAPRAAWERLKPFQDRKFVAFVERSLAEPAV